MDNTTMSTLFTMILLGVSGTAYVFGRKTEKDVSKEKFINLLKNPREYERIRHSYLHNQNI